jgi:hypothetical protein
MFACLLLWALCDASATIHAADTIKWKNLGPGGGGNMVAIAINPLDPNIILTGSDVGGIYRSGDGGLTWSLRNAPALVRPAISARYYMPAFGFDPVDPNIVYSGPHKSIDGGLTWNVFVDDSQIFAAGGLVESTSNRSTVYAFGLGNIYKSTDAWQSSWVHNAAACANPTPNCTTSCLPDPVTGVTTCPNYNDSIRSLVADPAAPTHLLACADSGLYLSLDGGTTAWTKLNPATLPNSKCNRLILDKQTNTLFIALRTDRSSTSAATEGRTDGLVSIDEWRGGIHKSTNFGTSWIGINGSDGTDLVVNGGFETAGGDGNHPAAGWDSSGDATITRDCTPGAGHNGSACALKIAHMGGDHYATTDLPGIAVQSGGLYRFSAWGKVTNGTGGVLIAEATYYANASQDTFQFPYADLETRVLVLVTEHPVSASHDWRRYEATLRVPDEATYVTLKMRSLGDSPGPGSTSWFDDVSFKKTDALPTITGGSQNPETGSIYPYFASYSDIVVDPVDSQILYVSTKGNTTKAFEKHSDAGGIWKTTDGGLHWSLVTRNHWHDNVMDGAVSLPQCGDKVCGGRWETCTTCPGDCTDAEAPLGHPTGTCCGDGIMQVGETVLNCLADVPFDKDPALSRPYFETDFHVDLLGKGYYADRRPNGRYVVWALAIGGGATGRLTLFFGNEHYKTTDGGVTWTEMTATTYTEPDSIAGTLQARGDSTDVFVYPVVTDARDAGRLYYGDNDNLVMVSYNGGKSFAQECWQCDGNIYANAFPDMSNWVSGSTPNSIELDPDAVNTIYAGIYEAYAGGTSDPSKGGAVKGVFDPAPADGGVGRWTWTKLGDQSTFPKGGTVHLLRFPSGDFLASVYSRGVYKLTGGAGAWTNTDTGSSWSPVPTGWKTTALVRESVTGRLYVAAGNLSDCCAPPPASETGVWESCDDGLTWSKITSSSAAMAQEPVTALLPVGTDTLFVSTFFAYGSSTADGGLYKGVRTGSLCDGSEWNWSPAGGGRVISQPVVTGIALSPASNSIIYALAGQVCCSDVHPGQQAGVYKSIDGGSTFTLLQNSGLMNLTGLKGIGGRLAFSATDSHRLYASSIGSGLFEGTITCGPLSEGFADSDGDLNPDCSDTNFDPIAQIGVTEGNISSGSVVNLGTDDDVYEVLQEQTSGSPRKLTKIWTFNVVTGTPYELRVGGFRNATSNDNFNFSFKAKASGSCSSSDAYGGTVLTVLKTTDDDVVQKQALGIISNPVLCLRVQDSKRTGNDSQTDQLSLDQVYLYAIGVCTDADGDGYAASCSSCTNSFCPIIDCDDGNGAFGEGCGASTEYTPNPGSIVSGGSYALTFTSNNQREGLTETLVNGKSQLVHTWKFSVPLGSAHTLHYEGNRTSGDGDNFQFYFSTSGGTPPPNNTFAALSNALIDTTTDTPRDSGTFLPNFSGVVHIQIRDTKTNTGSVLDTVNVDHLMIRTTQ